MIVVRSDLRDLRLPTRPFRVVASPPYQLSTELVAPCWAPTVCSRPTSCCSARRRAGWCVAPPRARHARRYRLEVGRLVPRTAFAPPPRVDSAVLRIRRR